MKKTFWRLEWPALSYAQTTGGAAHAADENE